MFFTYILISSKKEKTYTGHTSDLSRRLTEHNLGKSTFSKRYVPWKILYKEEFETEMGAIKREKYLKSRSGRRWVKKNFFSKN